MRLKPNILVLAALFCIGVSSPVGAQLVYKCRSGKYLKYTDLSCSTHIVNTDEAPVPVKPLDVRRREDAQAVARAMRRRPGETVAQFETRRHRARLLPEDSAECARLDKRMPVERASLDNPDPAEVSKAEAALRESGRRFNELRC